MTKWTWEEFENWMRFEYLVQFQIPLNDYQDHWNEFLADKAIERDLGGC